MLVLRYTKTRDRLCVYSSKPPVRPILPLACSVLSGTHRFKGELYILLALHRLYSPYRILYTTKEAPVSTVDALL